ncbi:hypothetical protein [Streptomyces sp. NPDC095613]|uniref:hypothetical protein n=1 Tax=Streptomyces sp. NPDC095613 TaxID=3155540 RepID=UPI00332A20D1
MRGADATGAHTAHTAPTAAPRARTTGGTALTVTVLTVGALFVLAPVGLTPRGCGDLSGGRLCVTGPIGDTGGFTVRYVRHGAGPGLSVRLGYQRKDERITAFPDWFGTSPTRSGRAELSRTIATLPGECIRGLLDHRGRVFVTEWLCS